MVQGAPPAWLSDGLGKIESDLNAFESDCRNESGVEARAQAGADLQQTLDLYARVKASDLDAEAKAGLELELGAKIAQFQDGAEGFAGAGPGCVHDRRRWAGRADREAGADRRMRRRAA